MTPASKALWFIESRLAGPLTLADIAAAAGVSRHHMARAFAEATGWPLMRYVRGRRLSEAARTLAAGAPDMMAVALSAGYESREAFTQAFRAQFGQAPEAVRALGHTGSIHLVEPLTMDEDLSGHLDEPRIVEGRPLLIAGISARHGGEAGAGIPAQWQRFAPHIGHVPDQIGHDAYGVCCQGNAEDGFEYLCGVEVGDTGRLPAGWAHIRLTAPRYAVFLHGEHIAGIRHTCNRIWNLWLPRSGLAASAEPFFERYTTAFDPRTGLGGVEIWIPLEP